MCLQLCGAGGRVRPQPGQGGRDGLPGRVVRAAASGTGDTCHMGVWRFNSGMYFPGLLSCGCHHSPRVQQAKQIPERHRSSEAGQGDRD